ncbi:MAG: valine--tRNA ligase [Atribacterota bacterium]
MERKVSLSPVFDARAAEAKWYEFWERSGYFIPSPSPEKPPFSIVIPPPNVTGHLHMGHALNLTLQDIVIRAKRMQGYAALWVPGTDHAGIATQNVVERQIAQEGLSRHDLGREEFLKRVWEWKEKYHRRIVAQLKRLGASCDWTRERFTMDAGLSRAVREVFVRLFEEGLIYQGEYIVNWCPRCETALADIEVEYREVPGKLYFIRYPFIDNSGFLLVATTRPETMLGDVALAVHPEDLRYQKFLGRKVRLPLLGREIPVIADAYVDREFGTGVLKVTPAHDPYDFEIGRRHNLPLVRVIDSRGFMTAEAGPFAGLPREKAREEVLRALEQEGLLERVEDHVHAVGHCYRCGTVIEPLVSRQWFVRMKELARPAIQAVAEGKVVFVPERWAKVYFEWMENIKDWCISRQIWWGHRIPVFSCTDCGYTFAHREDPTACPKCGGKVVQDEDVLDTWFSSALWPFSTLGWPEATEDLARFYPTSLLVTGFDIIFFWVARMIMMGLKFMGEVPFRKVYITPLVRDAEGRKMSKSLGNAIDPIEVVEQYGSDALRFALAWLTVQGRDIHLSMQRIEAARSFVNKLWNASRFVLMNLDGFSFLPLEAMDLDLKDRWILSRFHKVLKASTEHLEALEFGEFVQLLYDFVWGEYCDWYVEWSKDDLYQGEEKVRKKTQNVLLYVLSGLLRLLHPVVPFVTEEIWQHLPAPYRESESVMVAPWPLQEDRWFDDSAERDIALFQELIREIRYLRAELRVPPAAESTVWLNCEDDGLCALLSSHKRYIEQLARCSVERVAKDLSRPRHVALGRIRGVDVYLFIEGVVDVTLEAQRLAKKLLALEQDLERLRKRLDNPDFLTRAPEEVVEEEKRRYLEAQKELGRLQRLLESIQ